MLKIKGLTLGAILPLNIIAVTGCMFICGGSLLLIIGLIKAAGWLF